MQVVGERPHCGEVVPARYGGAVGSENAGMSSENVVRTYVAGSLRFPTEGQSASGESGLSRGRNAQAMDSRSKFLHQYGEQAVTRHLARQFRVDGAGWGGGVKKSAVSDEAY